LAESNSKSQQAVHLDLSKESHVRSRFHFIVALLILGFPVLVRPQQQAPTNVSLIELIANPDKFDGKPVLVTGFLRLEFEGDVLYLSEGDYLHQIPKNGVWVERSKEMIRDLEKLDSNYVVIAGVFNARRKGHQSAASGSIEQIRTCMFWSKPSNTRNQPNRKH
jgi:hypothetical protein